MLLRIHENRLVPPYAIAGRNNPTQPQSLLRFKAFDLSLADHTRVPAYLADFHMAALLETRWVNLDIAASGDTAFASKMC